MKLETKEKKRFYGEHFTPIKLFNEYIYPWIMNDFDKYIWVDLFAGEGNLILPILDFIPKESKIEFFKNNIFMFEIQKENYYKLLEKTVEKGIPLEIAKKNIFNQDTIKDFPVFITKYEKPVFHITNPPYLYFGFIVKNKERYSHNFEYFKGENQGYQDLYQLALINDLRNNINKMIYIIPSNFIFGASVSNKIRKDFFYYYSIDNAIIFEKEIFEFTGTNVIVCNFRKKKQMSKSSIIFEGTKINHNIITKKFCLEYKNSYRAGNELFDFTEKCLLNKKIKFSFYLEEKDIEAGDNNVLLLDANNFKKNQYVKFNKKVNLKTLNYIKNNILFIRTVDTGTMDGRAGLYSIKDVYDCDGIIVTKSKFRTHPIQLFFDSEISIQEQLYIQKFFNIIIEYLRELSDSEFLTTYKYSNSAYIRKYLGLSQVKKIIETYPYYYMTPSEKAYFVSLLKNSDSKKIIDFVENISKNDNKTLNIKFLY